MMEIRFLEVKIDTKAETAETTSFAEAMRNLIEKNIFGQGVKELTLSDPSHKSVATSNGDIIIVNTVKTDEKSVRCHYIFIPQEESRDVFEGVMTAR